MLTSTEKALESSIHIWVSMKIYYSKFVGVGYLVAVVLILFNFSTAHGLIDFFPA